jgi:hypothetical protein
MAVPFPGAGTALGALGGFIDASRYNGINAQYGVPGTVNPWGSAAHEILSAIGVPFTDWDLANLFDVPSARARHLGLVDDAGYVGREAMGYGALAANQPVGTPTRESGQLASYPAGFIESDLQPSHGLPAEQAAALNQDVERTIAANPEVFGMSAADPTATPGNASGPASDPGNTGFGDPWGGGWYAKGGVVGAPPGRFAAGGAVRAAGRMPTSQPLVWPENQPRQQWSDIPTPGGAGYGRRQYDDPAVSPRERAINEAMDDYIRGQLRLGYPDEFARGGVVGDANITPAQFGLLRGIDPPGPDDQIAAVQSGEGVLTRATMKKYPGLLDAANAGKINPKKLTGLLAVVPVKARRR